VSTGLDFKDWKFWRAGYSASFPNASIHDIVFWKGYCWLATEDGVIRYSPQENAFRRFGYFDGLRSDKGFCLLAGQNALTAGTERGAVRLEDPNGNFKFFSHPKIPTLRVYGLAGGNGGDWVATQYGLFKFNKGEWGQPGKIHLTKGLKIKDVTASDSGVFWIDKDKIMTLLNDSSMSEICKRKGLKKLELFGNYLLGIYTEGLVVYNLKNGLWEDFHLNDGIIGTVVNAAAIGRRYIWIATDRGITRLDGRRFLP
jgi:ligand-binding sensor domain-containing protein